MNSSTSDLIRSLTPIVLAGVGAVIGIFAVVSPAVSDQKSTAALGLAGTAIAGAAGLAQTGKNESDFSVRQNGETLQVTTPHEESSANSNG